MASSDLTPGLPPGPPPSPKRWGPVDIVALVLAVSLGLTVVLIMVATTLQIVYASRPEVTLSENATQVLVAGTGGLTGLLGAYVGMGYRGRPPGGGE
jgi:hypothetical protein